MCEREREHRESGCVCLCLRDDKGKVSAYVREKESIGKAGVCVFVSER